MTSKRRKELKRIRQFIRRAEKRGYIFQPEFKKNIETKTTRALQFLTPRKLYENAEFVITAASRDITVPGLRGRQIERERAARKGVETRRRRNKGDVPLALDIVYNNIIDLINTYPSSKGAEYLSNLLKSEIAIYGYNKVISSLYQMKDAAIRRASEIMYYEGDSMRIHDALRSFSDAIRGYIVMDIEEAINESNILESL